MSYDFFFSHSSCCSFTNDYSSLAKRHHNYVLLKNFKIFLLWKFVTFQRTLKFQNLPEITEKEIFGLKKIFFGLKPAGAFIEKHICISVSLFLNISVEFAVYVTSITEGLVTCVLRSFGADEGLQTKCLLFTNEQFPELQFAVNHEFIIFVLQKFLTFFFIKAATFNGFSEILHQFLKI